MFEVGRQKSISGELTKRLVAAIVLISALSLSIVIFAISRHTATEHKDKSIELAENLFASIELPLWNYERAGIENICNAYLQYELIAWIRLRDCFSRRTILWSTSQANAASAIGTTCPSSSNAVSWSVRRRSGGKAASSG